MKRLWAVAVIAALLTGICVCSLLYQHGETKALQEQLDALDEAYRNGDPHLAEMGRDFAEETEKRTELFHLFINHAPVTEIRLSAEAIAAILSSEDTARYPVEAGRCRVLLGNMLDTESPSINNIF